MLLAKEILLLLADRATGKSVVDAALLDLVLGTSAARSGRGGAR